MLTTREAALRTAAILREAPAPQNAASGRISFKTGTSWGYRDAWAIGFDRRTTIAVWIGRPDAASVPGLIGREAAAPVLYEAFSRLDRPLEPVGLDFVETPAADLPPPLRRFLRPGEEDARFAAAPPPQIAFPPDGARLDANPRPRGHESGITVPVRISGGLPPFVVLANGAPIHRGPHRRLSWTADGAGFSHLVVIDSAGRSADVNIRIDAGLPNSHVKLTQSSRAERQRHP